MVAGRIVFLVILVALLVGAGVWAANVLSRKGEVKGLRERYLRETGLPLGLAYDRLERHLERMMQAQPGKSMAFYLRSALAELERDRR